MIPKEIHVRVERTEWMALNEQEKKTYLNRLAIANSWLGNLLLQSLKAAEAKLSEQKKISIAKTMAHYYGDE